MDNDKYIGRLLDNRYEIQEVIGVGGMAIVYKARCHRLNRLVAIKILKDEYSQDEEFRRRFHAEGQAVAMLSHPNIVSVHDVSTSNAADYIVMELIDGISLKQYMEMKGVLNWKETLHFAIQISKALEHAHSRGIVHRDIKPHNVMVLKNGSVKVADFGIARIMSKSNTLTKEALGSVHYISPEQAKGGRVDNRTDIYSMGVVMYEMITGRPPYDGESPVAVAIQHINGGAKLPSVLNPNVPGGLEQIIMKAMAQDPAKRYTSATALLSDLDEFRKLPTILFDYNTPPTDEVTRLKSSAAVSTAAAAAVQKSAPAEPVAPRRREQPQSRPQRPAQSSAPKRRPAPKVNRWRDFDEDEDRSKVATIAIVACSAVAVIAIAIFLIALFNGGMGGGQHMVVVPTLVGKNYDTLPDYTDIVIDYPDYTYHDSYEKGKITYQQPAPGVKVKEGTVIHIKVSLGVEPAVKTMEDLVNQKQTVAKNFLKGQGIEFLEYEEHSSSVAKGCVTRTEPSAGQELKAGQVVKLYISTGPAVLEREMPNVVNQSLETAKVILDRQELNLQITTIEEIDNEIPEGYVIRTVPEANAKIKTGDQVTLYVSKGPAKAKMINVVGQNIERALENLNALGFTNIKYDEVLGDPGQRGKILEQSVPLGTEIPVSTQIELKVVGPLTKTKTWTFEINPETVMTTPYTLEVLCNGEIVGSREMQPHERSITIVVEGRGIQSYEVRTNGQVDNTIEVNFDE